MTNVSIGIYSYKSKNLFDVVSNAIKVTQPGIDVSVIDQNPIDRTKQFEKFDCVYYRLQFWDFMDSPCNLKYSLMNDAKSDYVLLMSDDVMLSPGWKDKLINFVGDKEIIISGQGKTSLVYKDKYFIDFEREESEEISLTNAIDRNFIFMPKSIVPRIDYPIHVKYLGEEEALAMEAFNKGIPVYSAPSGTYTDLGVRTLENLYTPFSTEHNYNDVLKEIRNEDSSWSRWHGIDRDRLREIPYPNNDVNYNPYDLQFNKVEQERFIDDVNGIY